MSYPAYLAEDRRLVILRFLAEAQGYSGNESLLTEACISFGHHATRDQVRGDLAWLEEQGLVALEQPGGIMVATIKRRGADVAAGRAQHPGVKRRGPEA
jgi:DNA-binding transcriptional ArsR family regulator